MRNKRGKFTRVPAEVPVEELSPLDITCGSTKCEEELVDWSRVHKHDIKDVNFMFSSMKDELIRHVFWHTEIDTKAKEEAITEGLPNLKRRVKQALKTKVGKFNAYMDGRQTPMGNGDIINYAQHATATCCRKCIEIWHNIPPEQQLSEEHLDFFTELVLLYALDRIPELNQENG